MEYFWLTGAIILLLVFIFDRNTIRFELFPYLKFLKILVIGSALSIVVNLLVERLPPFSPVPVSSLLFVWSEDILFSLLLLHYAPKFLPERFHVPVMIMGSFVFGALHLYQGLLVATVISTYPFISSYFGKKYGWGTVCLAHVSYDLIIAFNVWSIHSLRLQNY